METSSRGVFVFLCLLPTIYRGEVLGCTHAIPHGAITWWCNVTSDFSCPYSCNEGYDDHEEVSWVSCRSGIWVPTYRAPHVTEDKLCTPKQCPGNIPNGKLISCEAKVGKNCSYKCDDGYQQKLGISTISCQTTTNWSVDPHSLCTNNNQCPYELAHGDLDLSCTRRISETCNYTCALGYLHSSPTEPREVTCGPSLTWNKPLSSVCEKIQCPKTINNGFIPATCSRDYGSYCYEYQCNGDYKRPSAAPSLKCSATGQWDWEKSMAKMLCAREEDLCPSDIKNGEINPHCSRQPGDTCTYDCFNGCEESSTTWLRCRDDRTWNTNTNNLCIRCPYATTVIPSTTTITTAVPILCDMGYWYDATFRGCIQCPVGMYQDELGQTSCKNCPVNTKTNTTGAYSITQCYGPHATPAIASTTTITIAVPVLCDMGSWYDATFRGCIQCPVGMYQDEPDQTSCKKCPVNTKTKTTGASSITQCYVVCEIGYWYDTSTRRCNQCPLGMYQDERGQTSCKKCPVNTKTAITGAYTVSQCYDASYSSTTAVPLRCNKGSFYDIVAGDCIQCPKDMYQDERGQMSCKECPFNTKTNTTGAYSLTHCFASKRCPSTIPNGKIDFQCSRTTSTWCRYTCFVDCYNNLGNLYCSEKGSWESSDIACQCKETSDGGDQPSVGVGVLLGSIFGTLVLVAIVFAIVCVIRFNNTQRQQRVVHQQPHGVAHQPTIYHRQTQQTTDPGVINPFRSATNPTTQALYNEYLTPYPGSTNSSGQINQYMSLQEQYNNYQTPYSVLQSTTQGAGTNTGNPPEYTRIGDTRSGDYSTIADVRSETDNPPSYEEVIENSKT